jgi:DNA polymerase-3 subunit epsilon
MDERLDQITQDRIIDTLVIARDEFPGQQINLDSLVKKLKINSMVNRDHHGALKDAKILTDVYLELRGHTQMGFNLSNKNDNIKKSNT